MAKNKLFFIVLIVIISYSILVYIMKPEDDGIYKPGDWLEADRAVNQAKHFYSLSKARNEDLSMGPCLSDALMPNWVVDIVHNPRVAGDELSENQCPSFREGKAKHFVELDIEGNVVRVK